MPYKAPKAHERKKRRDARPSATRRGYGGTWRRMRRMVLVRHPLCADCLTAGRVTQATDVHHVIAKRDGGKDALDNLEALCHSCHSKRTGRGE